MNDLAHGPALAHARFVFHSFVVVADADERVSPREVERLHDILAALPAGMPISLRNACIALQGQYAQLWKSYQAGELGRTMQSLQSHWALLKPGLGDEALAFASSWLCVLDDVVKAGAPVLARLGVPSEKMRMLERLREAILSGSALPIPESPAASSAPVPAWRPADLLASGIPSWTRGKTTLRCVAVVQETHNVKSFHFSCDEPRLFTFRPGQFVTFDAPVAGKAVRRSYTISSSPSRPHALAITVKRMDDGVVSAWLHENMALGRELTVFGPNGDFTCLESPSAKLLFIAAGSGITPLMSMLRWLSDTFCACDVAFLDFVHSPDDIIFHDEMRQCSARMGSRLRLTIVPATLGAGQKWDGHVGHVSHALLRALAPDLAEREAFVCGPAGFMEAVRGHLLAAGLPAERYHQESFGGAVQRLSPHPPPAVPRPLAPHPAAPASAPAASEEAIAPAAAAVEVVFARSGKTIACTADDILLEVAEANGIEIANSCRSGTCGTCKTRRLEGAVELEDQRALSEADLADGYVLACVGRARGRVVLDA